MHLKEFIEKAIEGGWNKYEPTSGVKNISFDGKDKTFMICDKDNYKCTDPYSYAELVLDPKAWEAVGKSLGWGDFEGKPDMQGEPMTKKDTQYFIDSQWKERQKGLITHLQDDGTTESYIKTL